MGWNIIPGFASRSRSTPEFKAGGLVQWFWCNAANRQNKCRGKLSLSGVKNKFFEDSLCFTVRSSASEEPVMQWSHWFTQSGGTDCGIPFLLSCNVSTAAVVTITLRQLPSVLASLRCRVCAVTVSLCADEREMDHPPQKMCWLRRKVSSHPWHITHAPPVILLVLLHSCHCSEPWEISERAPSQADKPHSSGLWSQMCVTSTHAASHTAARLLPFLALDFSFWPRFLCFFFLFPELSLYHLSLVI